MLKQIRTLLKEHGSLSLRELGLLLKAEPSAVEPMMEYLSGKGMVELIQFGCSRGNCAGCSCSSREDTMMYRLL